MPSAPEADATADRHRRQDPRLRGHDALFHYLASDPAGRDQRQLRAGLGLSISPVGLWPEDPERRKTSGAPCSTSR
jgi:hypothetical protein